LARQVNTYQNEYFHLLAVQNRIVALNRTTASRHTMINKIYCIEKSD